MRSVSMSAANDDPMPRTEPMPKRTAWPEHDAASGCNVAAANDVLMSGVCVMTPWRVASCTSECGDQKPMGCALSNAAQNAAGSWNLIHAEA